VTISTAESAVAGCWYRRAEAVKLQERAALSVPEEDEKATDHTRCPAARPVSALCGEEGKVTSMPDNLTSSWRLQFGGWCGCRFLGSRAKCHPGSAKVSRMRHFPVVKHNGTARYRHKSGFLLQLKDHVSDVFRED